MELLEILSFGVYAENWFWWFVLGGFWVLFSVIYLVLGGPWGWALFGVVCVCLTYNAYELWGARDD